MSYDIFLEIDTGGKFPARVTKVSDPTYNLGPMFALALGCPLRNLDGKSAGKCIPLLQAAVKQMRKTPARFKKLNPENGWGEYGGAVASLEWLLTECIDHPKATVRI